MTEATFAETMAAPGVGAFDAMAPENVSPLVVWLGSGAAADGVTGRVFEVEAGRITVMEGWRPGPTVDKQERWTPAGAGDAARELLAQAAVPGVSTGRPEHPRGGPAVRRGRGASLSRRAAYVSHSHTVRHSAHRARTRPRTGTRIR